MLLYDFRDDENYLLPGCSPVHQTGHGRGPLEVRTDIESLDSVGRRTRAAESGSRTSGDATVRERKSDSR